MKINKFIVISIIGGSLASYAAINNGRTGMEPMRNDPVTRTYFNQPSSSMTETQKWQHSFTRSDIMVIQETLAERGFYEDRVDGIIGPKTKTAIREFQTLNDIKSTGVLDRETLNALNLDQLGRQGVYSE
ncbi:MAG: peptidoglycan-binding protein [Halobacteriovoraceae bacterium]|nr:peptidoglycan-binding protein [Halobacteriovoraceae bacterium]